MKTILSSLQNYLILSFFFFQSLSAQPTLELHKVIQGYISPKSIGYSGNGRFFAQNMMYQHSITVYDKEFNLVKTISDKVELSNFKQSGYTGAHRGAPVEVAFSPDGSYAWVSNYKMYGSGFDNPSTDNCKISNKYDKSFVYQINTHTLKIEQVIAVGCVPKYLATTPNGKYLLVSNWCSGDLSIIDIAVGREIKRIDMGRYPRGIVVDSRSQFAYIAIMGARKIARLNLNNFSVSYIQQVGQTPRHLCISPDDRYLYITLSREGKIARYDLIENCLKDEIYTGKAARSMTITPEGQFAYVVNYKDDTFSKIDLNSFKVVQTQQTHDKPIGITFDPHTATVWVACYSGSIMVFKDKEYKKPRRRLAFDSCGGWPNERILASDW